MKQIFLDKQPTSFFITENGFLYRSDTDNWYTPYENGGYLSYMLKWDGKSYHRRIHRLLAETYIPNPNNLPFVHHKDNDPYNNSLENLEWVSIEENNKSENKLPTIKQEAVYPLAIDNLPDEEWRQYEDSSFYISNLGRVKNKKTSNILKGTILKTGYLRVVMKINGKAIGKFVHRLVWETFNGEIKGVINHKDGNRLNNSLSNLEDITQRENILKSVYVQNTNHSKKIVGKYDENGTLIQFYESLKKAGVQEGVHETSILQAIRNHTRSCGFYWNYIEE